MSEESRMKKTIIRIAVCVVVFLASALIIGSIMNQGHNNMTMEMAPATLPMITMESGGVACNELHGNTVEMDVETCVNHILEQLKSLLRESV